MKEYQQRQEAIKRYLQGEKVAAIARSMYKSRKWLHHWIKRYKTNPDDVNWYEDESKAPKNVTNTLDAETEKQILFIRKELMNEKMAQTGAISIQYECERRGIKPLPAVWTINRVIAKHGLNNPPKADHKAPKDYPDLFWHTHQMDLVGPRYIKGDGKFYSINLIDTATHSCFVKAVRTKSSDGIVQSIASFWQTHGMPDALQMDNELAFRGSNRYPRSFGSVIRFALSQGVTPVFIPVKEPWRNGIIEKFNHTYQKKFLQAHTFKSLDDLCAKEQSFISFHNCNHRYSSQGHKTPNEMKAMLLPAIYYKGTEHLPSLKSGSEIKIPLQKGCVYYIRFIRGDLKLYLPNEAFAVKELKYSYVVAEINIHNHSLIIRQNGEIKQVFAYTINAIEW
ncbi:MAG: integrase core domain-containing protein [Panacibacter sp.]